MSSNDVKKFVVSGGGTGGHIYPAIAIVKMCQEIYPDCDILYIGTEGGMESDLVPREGIAFKGITVAGFKREISLKIFSTIAKAIKGFFQSRAYLKEYKPDLVIGTGGYVSGPVLLAAVTMGIPIMLHEQNVYPGITNRLLSRYAKVSAISWDESRKHLKKPDNAVLTGNPIRAEITLANREESRKRFGLDDKLPVILIFGGSQGAARINQEALLAAGDMVKDNKAIVILVTGKAKYQEMVEETKSKGIEYGILGENTAVDKPMLLLAPYIYDMAEALASADLVVCRSGAITLAELTARGIPSILIPHPFVPDNVQEKNARALEAKGAAIVLLDGELSKESLNENVSRLINDPQALSMMKKSAYDIGIRDATQKLSECVKKSLGL